jgi:hypothetical protein
LKSIVTIKISSFFSGWFDMNYAKAFGQVHREKEKRAPAWSFLGSGISSW